jgi:hypothetical protein
MKSVVRVIVETDANHQKLIHWLLDPSFRSATPVEFFVDRARAGGPWEQIGSVTDDCVFIDSERLNWNKDTNTFYRIRFYDGAVEQLSEPEQATGSYRNKRDFNIVNEIIRKEFLLRNTYDGVDGNLLIRREWGVPCTECREFDTGGTVSTRCPECLGTGFVGGFYSPIDFPLFFEPMQNKTRTKQVVQTVQGDMKVVRAIARPSLIKTGDVWVNGVSNERWVIRDVQHKAEYQGRVVIYQLGIRLAPKTDYIYEDTVSELVDQATDPQTRNFTETIPEPDPPKTIKRERTKGWRKSDINTLDY